MMMDRMSATANNSTEISKGTYRQTASLTRGVVALVISAAGALGIIFAVACSDGRELLTFGILAFAAGLSSVRLASRAASANYLNLPIGATITLASVPFLGPGAAVPALLACLAETVSDDHKSEALSKTLFQLLRRPAAAFVGGSVFYAVAGELTSVTIIAFAAGAAAYSLVDLISRLISENLFERVQILAFEYCAIGTVGWFAATWRLYCPSLTLIYAAVALVAVYIGSTLVGRKVEDVQAEISVEPEPQLVFQTESERPSFTDPLTGLANDRYLYMFIQQEIGRSVRKNLPVSLILLDIDGFQEINDKHGVEAGDAAMVEIGTVLRDCVREYDIVARHSSDEFAIALPEAKSSDACDTAERIRRGIAQRKFSNDIRLQVSLGVATYPEHGLTPDNLVSSAHHALNRAKFSGKDRVISCTELVGKLKYGT